MVIKKIKNILLVLFLFLSFQMVSVRAENRVEQVTNVEEKEEVVENERNFFDELYYRIVLKDEPKDFFDYILFATFVVALLIVMVFQNTHYVIVKKPIDETNFLESTSDYTIEEVVEESKKVEEEPEEVTPKEVEIIEESNPEILSSDLLEEEIEIVPDKKKNRNSKKKRA